MQAISDILLKLESEFVLFNANNIWAVVLGLIFAVVYCFFGYRLVKVFVTLFGALFGGTLGIFLARLLEFNESWVLVSIVLGMIIFGVLAFFVFRLGVAFMVGTSSFSILLSITKQFMPTENAAVVVAVISAILVGVITLWAARTAVIITSAISGGLAASAILFDNLLRVIVKGQMGKVDDLVILIVGVIIAIFGMIIQFRGKK